MCNWIGVEARVQVWGLDWSVCVVVTAGVAMCTGACLDWSIGTCTDV